VGAREPRGWWGAGRDATWADAIDIALGVASTLGVALTVRPATDGPFHPGRTAVLVAGERIIGFAGELHPRVLAAYSLPARACALELDLDALTAAAHDVAPAPDVRTQPVAKEDIALVVADSVPSADVAEAVRLLKALPGVGDVRDRGRLGVHHVFEIPCAQDLREDVGALANAKRWAIRELSWQRPSLEQLFARIALDLPGESDSVEPAQAAAPEPSVQLEVSAQLASKPALQVAPLSPFESAPSTPPPSKIVYNLNPFDMGASRDLSKPKPIDGPGVPPKEGA